MERKLGSILLAGLPLSRASSTFVPFFCFSLSIVVGSEPYSSRRLADAGLDGRSESKDRNEMVVDDDWRRRLRRRRDCDNDTSSLSANSDDDDDFSPTLAMTKAWT